MKKIGWYIKFTFLVIISFVIIVFVIDFCYSLYKSNKRIIEARKIDPTIWDEPYKNMQVKDKYKIVMITTHGGEWMEGKYLQQAAQNLGWEFKIYYRSTQGHENEIIKFDPDFMFFTPGNENCFIAPEIINLRAKKYGIYYSTINTKITDVYTKGFLTEYYFNSKLEPNARLLSLINLSDAILVTGKELQIFKDYYHSIDKKFYGLRTILTVYKTAYQPADPKYLTIIGYLNDKYRGGSKFKSVLSQLSEVGILKSYGEEKFYSFIPQSYKGYLGEPNALLDTINKNGITLIVHRKSHRDNAVPSIRIIEAVAANALVISDKNSFVIEHFGDNILYFDAEADADTIYNQIMTHVNWAKANPDQAKAMADRAHKIFLEKFTSEQDLIRIAKMHEKILSDEKARNLEFPVKY